MAKKKKGIEPKSYILNVSDMMKINFSTMKVMQNLVIAAAESQRLMLEKVSQAAINYNYSLNLALPSIKRMLTFQENMRKSLDPSLRMIAEAVRIADDMQNSILISTMSEVQRHFAELNRPFVNLTDALYPQIDLMIKIETITEPIPDLESIANSANSDLERTVAALISSLTDVVEELSSVKEELSEKVKIIEELKEFIKKLQDREKYFYSR